MNISISLQLALLGGLLVLFLFLLWLEYSSWGAPREPASPASSYPAVKTPEGVKTEPRGLSPARLVQVKEYIFPSRYDPYGLLAKKLEYPFILPPRVTDTLEQRRVISWALYKLGATDWSYREQMEDGFKHQLRFYRRELVQPRNSGKLPCSPGAVLFNQF